MLAPILMKSIHGCSKRGRNPTPKPRKTVIVIGSKHVQGGNHLEPPPNLVQEAEWNGIIVWTGCHPTEKICVHVCHTGDPFGYAENVLLGQKHSNQPDFFVEIRFC
jgi:hypothetical protein